MISFGRRTLIIILCAVLCMAASAHALVGPEEKMDDPALESRAQMLYTQIRCVVCQNQNIAESNAEIAQDLRRRVRTLLKNGDTDAQILEHLQQRYGDFVLMTPPFKPETYMLWLIPLLAGLGALGGFVLMTRNAPDKEENSS